MAAGSTVAGVGAALAGASGFATFATVAGGFMASAGILTGNKKLAKLGGILGLAGGVASLANSFSNSAATAAGDAASSAAGSTAAEGAKALSTEALNTGGLGGLDSIGQAALENPSRISELLAQQPAASGVSAGAFGADAAMGAGGNLMDMTKGAFPASGTPIANTPGFNFELSPALKEAAGQIKSQDHMQQLLTKLKTGAGGVGNFVKDNKELLALGGNVLYGMYGPQSEALDYQKSLMERRRQNLNTPIRMTVGGN